MTAPLDHIAPYPRTEEEATTDALIKHHAAFAEMHGRLVTWHFLDGPQWGKSIACVVSSYTAAYLLGALRDRVGVEAADEVARELWAALEAGDLPVWLMSDGEGLNHRAIYEAADRVAENILAKEAAAPPGRAAEVEQARADERARCVAELRRHSSERMATAVAQVTNGNDGGFAGLSYASTMERAARLLESGELTEAEASAR